VVVTRHNPANSSTSLNHISPNEDDQLHEPFAHLHLSTYRKTVNLIEFISSSTKWTVPCVCSVISLRLWFATIARAHLTAPPNANSTTYHCTMSFVRSPQLPSQLPSLLVARRSCFPSSRGLQILLGFSLMQLPKTVRVGCYTGVKAIGW
jgi:hypothetical protein